MIKLFRRFYSEKSFNLTNINFVQSKLASKKNVQNKRATSADKVLPKLTNNQRENETWKETKLKFENSLKMLSVSSKNIDFSKPSENKKDNSNIQVSSDLFQLYEEKRGNQLRSINYDKRPNERFIPPNLLSPRSDIIFGIFPVLLALKSQKRKIIKLFYRDDAPLTEHFQDMFKICEEQNIETKAITKQMLSNIAGGKALVNQGVCLETGPLPLINDKDFWEDAISSSKLKEKPKLWVFLEHIHDPRNYGAILRSSYYLGVDKVFVTKEDSCPVSGVVSKASCGIAEIYPIVEIQHVEEFIKKLKDNDWLIVEASTEYKKAIPLDNFDTTQNVLLLIGNEGFGLSETLRDSASVSVAILPHANCDKDAFCLNVSAAASIFMYTLALKLKLMGPSMPC